MIPDDQFPEGPYRPSHWPEWARDEIHTDVTLQFSWGDRLLVLLGRPVSVKVRTAVQNPPARCRSETKAWVHRFRWPFDRHQTGYAEIAP